MKNQNGITLIALVITIIVLLILAGVSIAMLTGDNGLLTKSQTAVMDNAIAGAKDEISLAYQEGMAEYLQLYYSETDKTEKAGHNIQTIVEGKINALLDNGVLNGCEVSVTSTAITVTKDTRKCVGEVTIVPGSATTVGSYTLEWNPITNVTATP